MKIDFNYGWKYFENGSPDKVYTVNIPHDAMLFGGRYADSEGGNASAYFKGGKYVYTKEFFVPKEWEGKEITFEFEGVYRKSVVAINGKEAGGCAYGFSGFYVVAAQLLRYGENNVITVTADNSQMPNCRWYSGGGIFRPVWLYVKDSRCIAEGGIKIVTKEINPAKVCVDVTHNGEKIKVGIYKSGVLIAESRESHCEFIIENALLWDDTHPELYECKVTVYQDDEAVDEQTVRFGIRKITWGDDGLKINGNVVKLKGACIHSDNGILGACSYRSAEYRRASILKANGFNAIRSAHNPISKYMLEACDELGLYIMDETFDQWYIPKNKYDYSRDFDKCAEADVEAMVKKDYNHPSVILYSIGNEVSEIAQPRGIEITKRLVSLLHSLDSSRPVTGGFNLMLAGLVAKGKGVYKEDDGGSQKKEKKTPTGSLFFNMLMQRMGKILNGMAKSKHVDRVTCESLDALDIAGYNYANSRYETDGKLHPGRLIIGSETYPQDIDFNWRMVEKYPYLIGDFMWAGWDYLGEVGVGAWTYENEGFEKPYPWLLADVGAIDITGYPNGEMYYARTVWGLEDKPYIGVRPVNKQGKKLYYAIWRGTNAFASWAWEGCNGNDATVEVYSATASKIRLELNGKKVGEKKVKEKKAIFKIKYSAGKLTAIALDSKGKQIGQNCLISATGKKQIKLSPENTTVRIGDVGYVEVSIVGENGVTESNYDRELKVCVSGAGRLAGFGSAIPKSERSYLNGVYPTYYGRALIAVCGDRTGEIEIKVVGSDLKEQSVKLSVIEEENIRL